MANRPKQELLDEKHWQALELIESGSTNMAEVAREVGISTPDFNHLIHGNVEKMGNRAIVFQREYLKIVDKMITRDNKASSKLMANCDKLAFSIFERELAKYANKKNLSPEEQKSVNNMSKAMAALKPSGPSTVKLSQSWHYTKGLSPQELSHEFSRLSGLAEGPPDTGAVREAKPGG